MPPPGYQPRRVLEPSPEPSPRDVGRGERLFARYLREEVAAFSPHYARALEAARVDPRRVRRPADLLPLALTTRDQLAGGEREAFRLRPTLRALREHWGFARKLALLLGGRAAWSHLVAAHTPVLELESRGRRGAPLGIATTGSDLETLAAEGAADLLAAGCRPGSGVVVVDPSEASLARWWLVLSAFRAGLKVELGAPDPLASLERSRAQTLWAPVAEALELARAARAERPRLDGLERVVAHGEALDDGARAEIAAGFAAAGARVRVLGAYVVTAVRAVLVEALDDEGGYPLPETRFLCEVLDPVSLEPAPPRAPGELVLTPTRGRGTAVIRYRTGDWLPEGIAWRPTRRGDRLQPRIPRAIQRAPVLQPIPQ